MKRYLLFAYADCYPEGGWNDFIASFDDEYEAIHAGRCDGQHMFHIIDLKEEIMVKVERNPD